MPDRCSVASTRYNIFEQSTHVKIHMLPGTVKGSAADAGVSGETMIRWIAGFAAVLIAYVFVAIVLCPSNPVIGFPVHHDDYTSLGRDLSWMGRWLTGARPVSYATLALLSAAGIPVYYLFPQLLAVIYVLAVIRLLGKIFGNEHPSWIMTAIVAAACFAYENVPEYSNYAGLVPSLMAGVFALAAMHLTFTSSLRPKRIAAILFLASLSLWSKEDFIAPLFLWICFCAVQAWDKIEARGRWLTLIAAFGAMAGALALYNRSVGSVFTSSAGAYAVDFSPLSIGKVAWRYAMMSPVTKLALILQLATPLWNLAAGRPVGWLRIVAFQGMICALAISYCMLPGHLAGYYPLNWVPWQIGGALVLIGVTQMRARLVAIIAAAGLAIILGQKGRSSIANWYATEQTINRNIIAAVSSKDLQTTGAIIVEGAPVLSPWFNNDGDFLRRRYGLNHQWIIYAPRNSEYSRLEAALQREHVRTVTSLDDPAFTKLPRVYLSADGTRASGAGPPPAILHLYPDHTRQGVRFQIQPSGASAMSVDGSGFVPGSQILWNAKPLDTAYGNRALISGIVPAELFGTAGEVSIQVQNPDGSVSPAAIFTVEAR